MQPYDRPPLSKEFLAGEVDERALEFRPQPWYAEHDVELLLGERAAGLDAPRREVRLAGGGRVPFERLLIATGSAPRRLAGTERYENVYELRTRDDARALREALCTRPRLIVIGAGFIGQEVAATAKRLGATVTIIEAAATPLEAILGPRLGEWSLTFTAGKGFEVVLSARIARFHGARAVHAVELQHARRIECDLLVAGIGTEPTTSWLRDSGLDQGGVRVDAAGRTAIPGIFAAGDASAQFEPRRRAYVRTEHWEALAPRRQRRAGDARPADARLPPRPASGATSTVYASSFSATLTALIGSRSTAGPLQETSPHSSPTTIGRLRRCSSDVHARSQSFANGFTTRPVPTTTRGTQHDIDSPHRRARVRRPR